MAVSVPLKCQQYFHHISRHLQVAPARFVRKSCQFAKSIKSMRYVSFVVRNMSDRDQRAQHERHRGAENEKMIITFSQPDTGRCGEVCLQRLPLSISCVANWL